MFFTAINQMMTEGVDLTLVIRKANGQLAVSVLPKSNGLKDEAPGALLRRGFFSLRAGRVADQRRCSFQSRATSAYFGWM